MKGARNHDKPQRRSKDTANDDGAWERSTGEGSETALAKLKQLELTRAKVKPKTDVGPAAS